MDRPAEPATEIDDVVERVLAAARGRLGIDVALLPEAKAIGFLGFPVPSADDDGRRVLCCVGRDPAVPLEPADRHAIELLATVVGEMLAADGPTQRRRRAIVDRVDAAIRSDVLSVVFQPWVDVLTGDVVGVEALSRFSTGPPRPDLWFAEARSVGLGVELELAAIARAIESAAAFDRSTIVAVNVSPATLHDDRLGRMLAAANPERLVLEITEHASIAELEELRPVLPAFRGIGVRLALDDVGAAFSSFTHVSALEPEFVKVDRSIVKGVHRDVARQSLMRAIVDVAAGVDASVIAEGVERQGELDMLATLGVGYAQGFLLAEPAAGPTPARVDRHGTPDPGHDEVKVAVAERDLAVRRFDLAMHHSPHGMVMVGLDGSFMHVNPAMVAMSGHDERELLEMGHLQLVHPDDRALDATFIEECLLGDRSSYRLEKRYLHASGDVVWGEVSVVLVRSEDGQPLYFIAQVTDTTERKAREQQLRVAAETDPLTGTANRAALFERLRRLGDEGRPFGVLFCDLVGFKQVNDSFGHQAGDHVLIAVADRLRTVTRDDDVVARLGGDEFVVVVPGISSANLRRLADRAQRTVARPLTFHPSGDTMTPGISIGIARHDPGNGHDPVMTLDRADLEMYRSRRSDANDPARVRRTDRGEEAG